MMNGDGFSGVVPGGAAPGAEPERLRAGVEMVPVRLRAAQTEPAQRPSSGRSGSTRGGFSISRTAMMDKLANVMPGNKARALLAQVWPDEEMLLCHFCPSGKQKGRHPSTGDGGAGDLELALRLPLRLATVARVADESISVALASDAMLERLRGVLGPGCEYYSSLKGHDQDTPPSNFTFDFQSSQAADLVMGQLQAAGCIVQGLHERYRLLNPFAKGSFGVVYHAEDLFTGAHVAVKIFTKDYEGKMVHPFLEVNLLREYAHNSILKYEGLFEVTGQELLDQLNAEGERTFAIVTEYLHGGELLQFVKKSGKVPEDQAAKIMRQLLQACAVLHEGGIVHRDIKLENIVLTSAGETSIKLIDFGLAASESDEESMLMKAGSPGYAAPEVVGSRQECKSDCFSCGVIMFVMLNGRAPFRGKNANEILKKNMLVELEPRALDNLSPLARDLIVGLMQKNPRSRMSAREALKHPWFTAGPQRPQPARSRDGRTPRADAPPVANAPQKPRHLPGLRVQRRSSADANGMLAVPRPEAALIDKAASAEAISPSASGDLPADHLLAPHALTGAAAGAVKALRERVAAAAAIDLARSPRVSFDISKRFNSNDEDDVNAVCVPWEQERPSKRIQAVGAEPSSLASPSLASKMPATAAERIRGAQAKLARPYDIDDDVLPQRDTSRPPSVERFTIGRRMDEPYGGSRSVPVGKLSKRQVDPELVMYISSEGSDTAAHSNWLETGTENAMERQTTERERTHLSKDDTASTDTSTLLIKKVIRKRRQLQEKLDADRREGDPPRDRPSFVERPTMERQTMERTTMERTGVERPTMERERRTIDRAKYGADGSESTSSAFVPKKHLRKPHPRLADHHDPSGHGVPIAHPFQHSNLDGMVRLPAPSHPPPDRSKMPASLQRLRQM